MGIAFIAKNKIGFVEGTYAKPVVRTPLFNQWDRCNQMVISWIMSVVVKTISDCILFSASVEHF